MKKAITLALCAAVFTSVSAQKTRSNASSLRKVKSNAFATPAQRGTAAVSGTLYPTSFTSASPCFADISVYDADGDYLAGNNSFGDKEFAMGYSLSDYSSGLPATVDTVKMFFGFRYLGSGNGTVRAKVYADDGTGAPGALIGTSQNKLVSTITDSTTAVFLFANPVTLTTNKFFVSLDIASTYQTGDTLALYSTDGQCATSTTKGAYLKLDDGTFVAYSATPNDGGYDAPFDLSVFPSVTANALGINRVVNNNFEAIISPVPATNKLSVAFKGMGNDQTSLKLVDVTGKTFATKSIQTTKGNSYRTDFDVSMLSRGLYIVEISSGQNKRMIKVSVQ